MIRVSNLVKSYRSGDVVTPVLRGIDLSVARGEWLAIMGRSGAGKSTLMYQMSLLDEPTAGSIIIDGIDTATFNEKERTDFRLRRLGYVFQDYALIPDLSALENVIVPLLMLGFENGAAYRMASGALDVVELAERHGNRPSQLSGGEQQRVSVARAIAQAPDILFADEPTANLDSVSGEAVVKVIRELHEGGQTVVMVTHEYEYAKYAQRVIHLDDGKVVQEESLA